MNQRDIQQEVKWSAVIKVNEFHPSLRAGLQGEFGAIGAIVSSNGQGRVHCYLCYGYRQYSRLVWWLLG